MTSPRDAYMNLLHRIVQLSMEHRRQTAQELNPAFLQLRIHPEDWQDVVVSPSLRYCLTEPKDLQGIQVVIDYSQQRGHPLLRSTWEMTL